MRRRYSDNDKAAALAALDANGGNVNRTAKQLGLAESTLRSWTQGRGTHEVVAELREVKKADLSDRLTDIAHAILDTLPKKLKDASAQQLATALGIVIDKKQLLEGKATDRTDLHVTSDEDRAARLAAIFDSARERRNRQSSYHADD